MPLSQNPNEQAAKGKGEKEIGREKSEEKERKERKVGIRGEKSSAVASPGQRFKLNKKDI
jgi:hypothetical protein